MLLRLILNKWSLASNLKTTASGGQLMCHAIFVILC
jgi:hypothetical protein